MTSLNNASNQPNSDSLKKASDDSELTPILSTIRSVVDGRRNVRADSDLKIKRTLTATQQTRRLINVFTGVDDLDLSAFIESIQNIELKSALKQQDRHVQYIDVERVLLKEISPDSIIRIADEAINEATLKRKDVSQTVEIGSSEVTIPAKELVVKKIKLAAAQELHDIGCEYDPDYNEMTMPNWPSDPELNALLISFNEANTPLLIQRAQRSIVRYIKQSKRQSSS